MSSPVRKWILMLAPLAAIAARVTLAAPAAPLKLPDLDALAAKASESVNVSLDAALLGLAAAFLDPNDPQDAGAKQVIAGLKGIYVRSFTFDRDIAYPAAAVDMLRRQLEVPGWQRLVGVRKDKEHSTVDIYVSVEQGKANGLVIIAAEPREFTVVNIVGSVDLERLRQLEGKFGIPKVPLPESDRPAGHL